MHDAQLPPYATLQLSHHCAPYTTTAAAAAAAAVAVRSSLTSSTPPQLTAPMQHTHLWSDAVRECPFSRLLPPASYPQGMIPGSLVVVLLQ